MTEQRYKAVLAVIGDGRTVGEVARDWASLGGRCTAGWRAMKATDWRPSAIGRLDRHITRTKRLRRWR